jgi:trk system potassium uptake protein TrkA
MKQFGIIGLGKFGYYLAIGLYERGHEVLAIDKDQNIIQEIKEKVNQAVIADATDRKAIQALGIKQVDAAIVCIGSPLSDSILVTLNLKDIGVKQIFAKAMSEAHGRILYKVGATEVFFPEKDMALSLVEKLHNPNMLDYLPIIGGYGIVELAPPRAFIGKALRELDLINQYGVQVVAIKEMVPDRLNLIPTGQFVLKDSDILILLGPTEAIDRLREAGS